jgi:hypothetical protein
MARPTERGRKRLHQSFSDEALRISLVLMERSKEKGEYRITMTVGPLGSIQKEDIFLKIDSPSSWYSSADTVGQQGRRWVERQIYGRGQILLFYFDLPHI